jgi:hypothetical protein
VGRLTAIEVHRECRATRSCVDITEINSITALPFLATTPWPITFSLSTAASEPPLALELISLPPRLNSARANLVGAIKNPADSFASPSIRDAILTSKSPKRNALSKFSIFQR